MPDAPIRQMSAIEARRSLIYQLGGIGEWGMEDMPATMEEIRQLPDEEVIRWTNEYMSRDYNIRLTIRQIQELEPAQGLI